VRAAKAPPAELEVLPGETVDRDVAHTGTELMLAERLLRDRHPVLVYPGSVSEGSRRTMRASLDSIAEFVSSDRADALTLAWHELRYELTAYIRAALSQAYAPANANKMLSRCGASSRSASAWDT